MTATRGFLAIVNPCPACEGKRSGCGTVITDTPAITIAAVLAIIDDVPCPYVYGHAFEAAMDLLRERIEAG